MNKNAVVVGLSIMVGLIVAGAMIPVAVKQSREVNRTVSVKGLCEREVKADKVIWPLEFKVGDNSLDGLYAQMNSGKKVIHDFLIAGGISPDEITVSIPKISDQKTEEYASTARAFRYIATSSMVVCTGKVDEVLALMSNLDALQAAGVALSTSWDSTPTFSFEGLNEIKPQMIQEATKNARDAAQKFAEDSQSKLGKIKWASQGTFSIESRDQFTPQIKKVRVVTSVDYFLDN